MTPHQGSRRTRFDRADAPLPIGAAPEPGTGGLERHLGALERERRRLLRELESAENLLRTLTVKRQQCPAGPASRLARLALRRVVERRAALKQLRARIHALEAPPPTQRPA